MYRLTERLGYRHVADLLADQTSAELTGWLSYLQVDDEAQSQRTAIAIMKAFGGGKPQGRRPDDEDEEIIDTTRPEFAQHFKGFVNNPQRTVQTQRPMQSTQIVMG